MRKWFQSVRIGRRAGARPRVVRLMAGVLSVGAGVLALGQDGPGGPPALTVPAHRQADNVAIIPIEGEINRVSSYSFQRRLDIAVRSGADAFVVELNTPGGEVGAVLEISNAIRNAPISNSVAWINPTAFSGGAIIALACKEIVTTQSVQMGDALPVQVDQIGQLREMPEAERQKITAPLLAEVVGSARLRGWDEFVVQGFVALGVELWWVRDPETGEAFAINEDEYRMLFEGDPPRTRPILASAPALGERTPPPVPPAPKPDPPPARETEGAGAGGDEAFRPASPEVAMNRVEGVQIGRESRRRTISGADRGRYELVGYLSTGDGPMTLNAGELAMLGFAANVGPGGSVAPIRTVEDLSRFFGAKNLRRVNPSWSESIVTLATMPGVRGVLLVIFLLMLFLEMSAPGVGLPGAIALGALVALLAPPALIGLASWWEIGAIVAGILLIFVEVFVLPGFGVPGVLGLLLLFGGMLGTFVGDSAGLFPDSPREQTNLLYGLLTMVLSVVSAVVGMYYISKHLGSVPLFGKLILSDERESDEGLLAAMSPARGAAPEIGAVGRTITPLRPSGRMELDDRVVDVVSEMGYVEPGTPVRVVGADTFRVVVEPVEDGPREAQRGG